MLAFQPEDIGEMKKRFPDAVADVIDVKEIRNSGCSPLPMRKHVFDFYDGMRMGITVDLINDNVYLHISCSGNEGYARSIADEGIDGLVEDMIIRLSALMGKKPVVSAPAIIMNNVLHMICEWEVTNDQ